jgi:hypothetical protein
MLKTSSAPFGVFTANRVVPSGDIAMGRTCPLSNSTKEGPVDAPETEEGKNSAQVSMHRAISQSATAHVLSLSVGSEIRRIRGKLLSARKLCATFGAQERQVFVLRNATGKKVYHKKFLLVTFVNDRLFIFMDKFRLTGAKG